MPLPSRLRLSAAARRRLAGVEPADLALVGGRVVNVFTRQVVRADVGIAGGRIAWVGAGEARSEVDLGGRIVVPGLIDPHAHGDIVSTPVQFAHEAVRHGTTAVVLDAYTLIAFLDDATLASVMDALERLPMKVLWGLRPTRDAGGPADDARLPLGAPAGVAGAARRGEHGRDDGLAGAVGRRRRARRGLLSAAVDGGLRVDGHLPGASARDVVAGRGAGHHVRPRGDRRRPAGRAGRGGDLGDGPPLVAARRTGPSWRARSSRAGCRSTG